MKPFLVVMQGSALRAKALGELTLPAMEERCMVAPIVNAKATNSERRYGNERLCEHE